MSGNIYVDITSRQLSLKCSTLKWYCNGDKVLQSHNGYNIKSTQRRNQIFFLR